MRTKTSQLILVGGGHGHLHILKQLQRVQLSHTEVTLISPSRFQYYSGMFSGYVEGLYSVNEIRIDLQFLAHKAHVRWIQGKALRIDPEKNTLSIDNGQQLHFDVISFDIGSLTAGTDLPGVSEFGCVMKPNYLFPEVFERAKARKHIAVVGGGAGGVETSLALQAWRKTHHIDGDVSLISSGRLLEREGLSVSRRIEAIAKSKGIKIYLNQAVQKVHDGILTTSQNEIAYDVLLWSAGAQSHPIFQKSGIAVDNHGYLLVRDTLQTVEYPHIFGIGDCISFASCPKLPKAGVHAVKASPVLWNNLLSYIKGRTLKSYRPKRHILSIISTSQEEGFLLYNGMSFYGHLAWGLKRHIDRNFVRQYQEVTGPTEPFAKHLDV